MNSRRQFLGGLVLGMLGGFSALAADRLIFTKPCSNFTTTDVWLGKVGPARTSLKRVVFSRFYDAGPLKQREMGGEHMPTEIEIKEATVRLIAHSHEWARRYNPKIA